MKKKKIILIIGGHDPTSGAGITADIETAGYFNYHPLSILTCSTIQNTSKVIKVNKMPNNYIYSSFKELIKEFKIDVIKIGLIPSIRSSKEILKILENKKIKNIPIIIDPIINSGSGRKLVFKNNINFVVKNLYPKALLLTPNKCEYNIIKKIHKQHSTENIKNILITDYKFKKNHIMLKLIESEASNEKEFNIKKFSKIYHGTGCTFSTAIACNISDNNSIEKSIAIALNYMKKVIEVSCIEGKKQFLLNRSHY